MSTPDKRLRLVTSRQNSLVKDLRRAFTQGETTADGYCAAEGIRLLEEAIRSSLRFKALFVSESAQERAQRLMPQIASHVEAILLPDEVFNSAVQTEAPQGVAALVKLKTQSLEDVLQHPDPLVLGAAGVQDPGNLGTMIRSAEAFGAVAVLAAEKTVNPLNPKVVRSSAGSIFRLPVFKTEWRAALAAMRERGMRIVATSSHKGVPVDEADLRGPLAIYVGSEGAGVPREILAEADEIIAIPHSPRVESLNAGIAASIILYEDARQRRS